MLAAVLFDLDATLVSDGGNWKNSVDQVVTMVSASHSSADADSVRERYYGVAGSVWEEIRGVEAPPWGNMDDGDIVRRVWSETLAGVGLDDADLLEQAVAEYLRLRRGSVPAFDDAQACLEALAPNFKLGVVTNGYADQQIPKLQSAGLSRYFQVVTTTDAGHGKPKPTIFLHALSDLDVRPEHAAYVGDSLSWDVAGANRAGLASVWLNRRGQSRSTEDPVPDAEVRSLTELPEALLRLKSRGAAP